METDYRHLINALQAGINREATAVQLYSRLAQTAPNQRHKYAILHTLQNKKHQLKHFTDLFVMLTGEQPGYEADDVQFARYQEGIQKAYQAEIQGFKEYQKSCYSAQHPLVRNAFYQASNLEREYAARLKFLNKNVPLKLKDYGGEPFVIDIEKATLQNDTFRTALWTGDNLQLTLMSIPVGEDIGLEVHPELDQFIRLEQGQGLVQMGDDPENLDYEAEVFDDYAIFIPAGKWHNVTNTGNEPMKVYAIYAPPEHPFGTVHPTKADALEAEETY
ncbi:cupin domain-containing protein [Pseudalkalibacillus sp. SCS-8]|uniref:cupin domain-containing protein n=1 Tax=Pseudalkalibacillus nanhaiensis TaxID=3115291 RepID=UPI0032DA559B